MESGDKLVLMNTQRINRSLKRIAHQIREKNRRDKSIHIFGIDDRGFILGQKLGDILAPLSNTDVQVQQILIKKEPAGTAIEDVVTGDSFMVVVDDVIFSGNTMFKALTRLYDQTQVPEIHTAVLVDRGHRKLPIMAEFSGMELPTKLNEHVSVIIQDGELKKVLLEKQSSRV